MTFQSDMTAWDGQSVAEIAAVYDRFRRDAGFVAQCLEALASPETARAASWLLKHDLERGRALSGADAARIIALAPGFTHWETRLHVLQILPYLTIPAGSAAALWGVLKACPEDEATFVRAWGYWGMRCLAVQHPDYRVTALAMLKDAEKSESAASAKVRLRKALAGLEDTSSR